MKITNLNENLNENHNSNNYKYNYLTLVWMAIIKKSTNINTGEGVKERAPSYTVGRNLVW